MRHQSAPKKPASAAAGSGLTRFNTRLLAEYWVERTVAGPVTVLVGYTYGVAKLTFEPYGTLGWKVTQHA